MTASKSPVTVSLNAEAGKRYEIVYGEMFVSLYTDTESQPHVGTVFISETSGNKPRYFDENNKEFSPSGGSWFTSGPRVCGAVITELAPGEAPEWWKKAEEVQETGKFVLK